VEQPGTNAAHVSDDCVKGVSRMIGFLTTTRAKVLSALLVAQAAVFYASPNIEYVPTMKPLEQMPSAIGNWRMTSQYHPDEETQNLLKADDALTRVFDRNGEQLTLFIAFFKTQRAGVVPHSPRVCLPGAGWTPVGNTFIRVPVPGRAEPIEMNRFVVTHGENKSIVFYWFQSPHHIVASEFSSKLYLMMDSVRYQRSDTSIVRVIVPVLQGNEAHADQVGLEFIKQAFPIVSAQLPS
jgi:EpsI family protein